MKNHIKLFEEFSQSGGTVWATLYWNNDTVGGVYDTRESAEEAQRLQLEKIWLANWEDGETRLEFDEWLEELENDWASADDVRLDEFDVATEGKSLLRTVVDSTPASKTRLLKDQSLSDFQTTTQMVKELISRGLTVDMSESFDSMDDLKEFFDGDVSWIPEEMMQNLRKRERSRGAFGRF
jgi:hypothetical protein